MVLASPITVWPILSVLAAAAVALFAAYVGRAIGANGLITVVLALLIGGAILSSAGTTTGTRVVYDRGGTSWQPGELAGAGVLLAAILVALS